MTKPIRLLVLNYTGYRPNWGCQATSRGLLQWIEELIDDSRDYEIDIIPFPPSHWVDTWQSYRYSTFIRDLYKVSRPSPSQIKRLKELCFMRFGGDVMNRLSKANIIFFQGEGSLGLSKHLGRTQLYGLPLLESLTGEKKIISINQTVTLAKDGDGDLLSAFFSRFDLNFVRESASLCINSIYSWPHFELIPDMALFYKPYNIYRCTKIPGPYICITGSAQLRGYDLKKYSRAIKQVSERWGLLPVFLYSRSSDSAIVNAYRKAGGRDFRVISSATHPDVDEIIPILSNAEAVIGGRYHTAISALSQCTPVILTESNSHKSEGLREMYNGIIRLVRNNALEDIIQFMEVIMGEKPRIAEQLACRLTSLRSISQSAQDQLKEQLNMKEEQCPEFIYSSTPNPELRRQNKYISVAHWLFRSLNISVYDRNSIRILRRGNATRR